MNEHMLASAAVELDTRSERDNVATDWMGPVEALTRFAPTKRFVLDGDSEPEEADVRYAIRIGDIGLLIGARVPTEFVLPVPVSRVPNTPDWFAGVMNLRGAILPLFDLEAMLGTDRNAVQTPPVAGEHLLYLVLDRGERAAALKIHGFPQALRGLEPLAALPPVPAPLDTCVSQAMFGNGFAWFEFDHLRLFETFSQRLAKPAKTRAP
jgi:twitching motility protein PilI